MCLVCECVFFGVSVCLFARIFLCVCVSVGGFALVCFMCVCVFV